MPLLAEVVRELDPAPTGAAIVVDAVVDDQGHLLTVIGDGDRTERKLVRVVGHVTLDLVPVGHLTRIGLDLGVRNGHGGRPVHDPVTRAGRAEHVQAEHVHERVLVGEFRPVGVVAELTVAVLDVDGHVTTPLEVEVDVIPLLALQVPFHDERGLVGIEDRDFDGLVDRLPTRRTGEEQSKSAEHLKGPLNRFGVGSCVFKHKYLAKSSQDSLSENAKTPHAQDLCTLRGWS
jgi:hypothetical protein